MAEAADKPDSPAPRVIDEPPSGFYVRARFPNHHTAAFVFHRDDREGNSPWPLDADPKNWWFHEQQRWVSWQEVVAFALEQPEPLVLEIMFAMQPYPSCLPDGSHEDCVYLGNRLNSAR